MASRCPEGEDCAADGPIGEPDYVAGELSLRMGSGEVRTHAFLVTIMYSICQSISYVKN